MFVCEWVSCLLPVISAPLRSTPRATCNLNQHDPRNTLAHNSFALTVYREVPLWCNFSNRIIGSYSSAFGQPRNKSRQWGKLKLKKTPWTLRMLRRRQQTSHQRCSERCPRSSPLRETPDDPVLVSNGSINRTNDAHEKETHINTCRHAIDLSSDILSILYADCILCLLLDFQRINFINKF